MFIDVSKLEKILKEDYKSWGVEIGLTEDGMYIVNGTGWIIEADESSITKEFLGTLIKICGPAPKRGEFIQYQKGSSLQYTTARSKNTVGHDRKKHKCQPVTTQSRTERGYVYNCPDHQWSTTLEG